MNANHKGALLATSILIGGLAQPVQAQGFFQRLLSGPTYNTAPVLEGNSATQVSQALRQRGVPQEAIPTGLQLLASVLSDDKPRTNATINGVELVSHAGPVNGLCRQAGIGFHRVGTPEKAIVFFDVPWCWENNQKAWVSKGGTVTGDLPPAPQAPKVAQAQPKPAQAPVAPVKVTLSRELDETRLMKATTPLRVSPSQTAESLGNLIVNTKVQVTGVVAGSDWLRISTNGKTGYALASYVEASPVQAPPVVAVAPPAPAPRIRTEENTNVTVVPTPAPPPVVAVVPAPMPSAPPVGSFSGFANGTQAPSPDRPPVAVAPPPVVAVSPPVVAVVPAPAPAQTPTPAPVAPVVQAPPVVAVAPVTPPAPPPPATPPKKVKSDL